jgi:hypothetical protein
MAQHLSLPWLHLSEAGGYCTAAYCGKICAKQRFGAKKSGTSIGNKLIPFDYQSE